VTDVRDNHLIGPRWQFRGFSISGTIALMSLFLGGCFGEKEEEAQILRLAHGLDSTHPVHIAMVSMGEEIERESGGRIRVRIYPSEQLGSEREAVELVQLGGLDIAKTSAAVMESFSESYRVFGVPYLFRGKEHMWSVLSGPIGKELLHSSVPFRLRGLCFYDAGRRSYYTKDTPIRQPADLDGLKIRVQESATAIAMVGAMGAQPTPISWGELYTALEQGVVDGAENNPPSYMSSRHYQVTGYFSLNEHTASPDVLLIGTRTWNLLSEEDRLIIVEAAENSRELQRRLWTEAEAEALEIVQEAGVTVIYPERARFAETLEPLRRTYRDDPVVGPLLERIEASE
jgi:tripartite ATP-independent transporter DctP family solute receptor